MKFQAWAYGDCMQMKDIMNCLPLVASVLSKKYGVNVIVGGDTAFTEGKNIHIPTLPISSDEHVLCMVRGFIDHESAHIRFTDFDLLAKEKLDTLTFHIFNTIEDWRVENELAKLFPGSQVNLHYLIRHFFVGGHKQENEQGQKNEHNTEAGEQSSAFLLLNYMLLTVRSWDVPEIAKSKGILQTLRSDLEPTFKGLLDTIDKLFQEIRAKCSKSLGTQGSIHYAKEAVKLIKNHCLNMEQAKNKGEDNDTQFDMQNNSRSVETDTVSQSALESLKELLAGKIDEKALPMDLGSQLAENISQNFCTQEYMATTIGEIGKCSVAPMFDFEKKKALTMSTALRARMQGLLQSYVRQDCAIGRRGRLHPHSLYRTSIHNPKIFCREGIKKGLNTAVHILLDASGSMEGVPISMARQACFALGKVLGEMNGVNPAITVFPANLENRNSLYPLLRHGQKLTDVTVQTGQGTTPLAPTLWWAMREMLFLKENRKIIFIITDGRPDCYKTTKDAIAKAEQLSFELYGIGIKDNSIEEILPKTSEVIMSLEELVPSVFAMLQKALLKS